MTNHGSLYTLCNIVLAYIYEKIIINIFILVFVLDLYPSPLAIQRILEVAFTAAAEAITQGWLHANRSEVSFENQNSHNPVINWLIFWQKSKWNIDKPSHLATMHLGSSRAPLALFYNAGASRSGCLQGFLETIFPSSSKIQAMQCSVKTFLYLSYSCLLLVPAIFDKASFQKFNQFYSTF